MRQKSYLGLLATSKKFKRFVGNIPIQTIIMMMVTAELARIGQSARIGEFIPQQIVSPTSPVDDNATLVAGAATDENVIIPPVMPDWGDGYDY